MSKLETMESLINSLHNARLKTVLSRALEAGKLDHVKTILLGAILAMNYDNVDFNTITALYDIL